MIRRRYPAALSAIAQACAIAAAAAFIQACAGPAGSVAIVDPVFAYLSPQAAKAYSKATGELRVLPEANASAALYAVLDSARPDAVFLSPLLASEIGPILSRNEETRVVYLGNASPSPDPRLYAAVFTSSGAAREAGRLVALEANAMRSGEPVKTAAVFSGSADAESKAEAFAAGFESAGGRGEPVIEIVRQGFSQGVADRLRSLDIRIAYVSAPPSESDQWARQAFDEYAFVAVERALPADARGSPTDAFVAWDVEATLASLTSNLASDSHGVVPGLWKTIGSGRYEGK